MIDNFSRKECFKCGKKIPSYKDGGQVTWSGFFDSYLPPYYNQVTLCRECHAELGSLINNYLMSGNNGKEN